MMQATLGAAGDSQITKRTKSCTLAAAILLVVLTSGCSLRHFAVNQVGDALSASGSGFATDDDPELIGAAAPFSLKLMESVLSEVPEHRGLLLSAAQGFVQYAYAFVETRADALEDVDLRAAYAQRNRARRLYLRGRDYGLRALETTYPGIGKALRVDPKKAVAQAVKSDTPLLYWTGVAWAAAISLAKDDPFLIAELPIAEALVRRALALDESYDHGSIHVFLISFEMAQAGLNADAPVRAREHFERAIELSEGLHAAPYVTFAESVSIAERDRKAFEQLLRRALELNVDAKPQWRLVNTILQRRARWLLSRTDKLFAD